MYTGKAFFSNKTVVTVGALHQLDLTTLRNVAIAWHDEFAPLPKPLIVGNFGGPTSRCKYGIDLSKQLTTYLRGVLDSYGKPNPHMGHLAWANAFIVTADSVSMLSEACSTGKPIYVIGADRCKWKFDEFHKTLRERGIVRPFIGLEDMSESWSYPPLRAATRVHEALYDRGWKLRP
ncbi:hypothetical protein QVD17_08542 [Tagetes erecta]|uniref:Mitochondrial fission protein ELM1 n=1 Tax=Tagetes erecta TaxID=13708 RepID=A0AAD8KY37_TARER|nr:hypothetical protein QVD17_08542 [Tagetes erecta]